MSVDSITNRGATPVHIGGAAVCVVLLVCGWFLGLGPLLTENHQATSALEQAIEAESIASQSKGELDRLTAELEGIRAELSDQPVNLQPATEINPLLAELAVWGDEHELSITRTRAGRAQALAYYDYVPIKLAGEGGFGHVLGFLRHIHQGRGDLGVVAFSARRLNSGAGIAFDIDLAWYVLSDDANTPEEQATASVLTE